MKNLLIVIMCLCCIVSVGCATSAIAESPVSPDMANIASVVEEYKIVPPAYNLSFDIKDNHLIIRGSDGIEVDIDKTEEDNRKFAYLMRRLFILLRDSGTVTEK